MAKNRNKPQVINNIQEMNIEIDYRKLADAILAAQEEIDKKSSETTVAKIVSLVARWLLRVLCFAGMAALFCFIIPIATKSFGDLVWNNYQQISYSVGYILVFVSVALLIFCFSIMALAMAHGIKQEKDKNYVMSVLSTLVAIIALLISVFV